MLLIHDPRLEADFESGGVSVRIFSELCRPSILGLFGVGFEGVVTAGGGGEGGFSVAGALEVWAVVW